MATLSGKPLYTACGYQVRTAADIDGIEVPLLRMGKDLARRGGTRLLILDGAPVTGVPTLDRHAS